MVKIEAVAERIAQSQATIGGTSGTHENIRNITLAALPMNIPAGFEGAVGCITDTLLRRNCW